MYDQFLFSQGNGGNEESVCFGEDLREDEAACNANTACVWETFEMGSGQEESGSCSELSCYNQVRWRGGFLGSISLDPLPSGGTFGTFTLHS